MSDNILRHHLSISVPNSLSDFIKGYKEDSTFQVTYLVMSDNIMRHHLSILVANSLSDFIKGYMHDCTFK